MPQTKYKIPADLNMRCISLVRGYNRMVKSNTVKIGSFDDKAITAIEKAKEDACPDVISERERERIIIAIMDSCINGRNFTFEYRALPISKSGFYRIRRKFIYDIAYNMGFI